MKNVDLNKNNSNSNINLCCRLGAFSALKLFIKKVTKK